MCGRLENLSSLLVWKRRMYLSKQRLGYLPTSPSQAKPNGHGQCGCKLILSAPGSIYGASFQRVEEDVSFTGQLPAVINFQQNNQGRAVRFGRLLIVSSL